MRYALSEVPMCNENDTRGKFGKVLSGGKMNMQKLKHMQTLNHARIASRHQWDTVPFNGTVTYMWHMVAGCSSGLSRCHV